MRQFKIKLYTTIILHSDTNYDGLKVPLVIS